MNLFKVRTTMGYNENPWQTKGATFSHKSAMKEFNLTEKEIFEAVSQGKLQYRENSIYGNPFLRLLRSEVEKYVQKKYGLKVFSNKKVKNELRELNKELKKLKNRISEIEKRKIEIEQLKQS